VGGTVPKFAPLIVSRCVEMSAAALSIWIG